MFGGLGPILFFSIHCQPFAGYTWQDHKRDRQSSSLVKASVCIVRPRASAAEWTSAGSCIRSLQWRGASSS